jgi:hypothetical protein
VYGEIAGMLLGGCARDPLVSTTLNTAAAGNWQIEKQIDRVTRHANIERVAGGAKFARP